MSVPQTLNPVHAFGSALWATTLWCLAAALALCSVVVVDTWGMHTAAILLVAVLLALSFLIAGYAGCYIADRLLGIYGDQL